MVKAVSEQHFLARVDLPADLGQRMKTIEKRLRTTRSQFIRDAVFERVETFEQKFRREEEERQFAFARKRANRIKIGGLGNLSGSIASALAGGNSSAESAIPFVADIEQQSKFAALYDLHGREILAAGSDEAEVRRRVLLAIQSVKRHCPLTHPDDKTILAGLEKVVVALKRSQPQAPTTRSYDDLVGAIVDVTKIKTSGKVADDDTE